MTTYSHSRLSCFEQCPRKYYYKYIARVELPDVPEQIATFLGSRVHDTLELLYKQLQAGTKWTREQAMQEFDTLWSSEWDDEIVIQDGLTADQYQHIGRECVAKYYDQYEPFDQSVTVGLERRITFSVGDDRGNKLTGFIDRLAKREDGTWEIHDYKTNKQLPSQQEKDEDQQFALYEVGIRTMWPMVQKVELIWHFVRFGESIVSTRTPEQLDSLLEDIRSQIERIESLPRAEESFKTNESYLCSYCDYQSVCPVRKHLVQVSVLPENKFANDDGVTLVDKWASIDAQKDALKDQIAVLDEKIDQIKEALIEFAHEHDLETVTGTDMGVTVRTRGTFSIPTKSTDPERHGRLVSVLRNSPLWDQLAVLDRHALKRLWQDPEALPNPLREMLRQFISEETNTRIQLRKGSK